MIHVICEEKEENVRTGVTMKGARVPQKRTGISSSRQGSQEEQGSREGNRVLEDEGVLRMGQGPAGGRGKSVEDGPMMRTGSKNVSKSYNPGKNKTSERDGPTMDIRGHQPLCTPRNMTCRIVDYMPVI